MKLRVCNGVELHWVQFEREIFSVKNVQNKNFNQSSQKICKIIIIITRRRNHFKPVFKVQTVTIIEKKKISSYLLY